MVEQLAFVGTYSSTRAIAPVVHREPLTGEADRATWLRPGSQPIICSCAPPNHQPGRVVSATGQALVAPARSALGSYFVKRNRTVPAAGLEGVIKRFTLCSNSGWTGTLRSECTVWRSMQASCSALQGKRWCNVRTRRDLDDLLLRGKRKKVGRANRLKLYRVHISNNVYEAL